MRCRRWIMVDRWDGGERGDSVDIRSRLLVVCCTYLPTSISSNHSSLAGLNVWSLIALTFSRCVTMCALCSCIPFSPFSLKTLSTLMIICPYTLCFRNLPIRLFMKKFISMQMIYCYYTEAWMRFVAVHLADSVSCNFVLSNLTKTEDMILYTRIYIYIYTSVAALSECKFIWLLPLGFQACNLNDTMNVGTLCAQCSRETKTIGQQIRCHRMMSKQLNLFISFIVCCDCLISLNVNTKYKWYFIEWERNEKKMCAALQYVGFSWWSIQSTF